ncbi:MAG TPA: Clp protease N-terminal domain-containing protein, partial [Nonomuraea sp.]|nr:Clp protease N-terminal domain-containing protein [Nonomuraea sp.]
MFERFTDRARRVVVLAQEEARRMNHTSIGTEHILLGLIREGEGLAALVLGDCGVELEHVRAFVERDTARGGTPTGAHMPFTAHAKKVLELSLREALQMRHNYIGTEHILLGLLKDRDGLAMRALTDAGADPDDVRRSLLDRLGGHGAKERHGDPFYPGGARLGEQLAQIQESLDRIER